jgi:hypothetical protein
MHVLSLEAPRYSLMQVTAASAALDEAAAEGASRDRAALDFLHLLVGDVCSISVTRKEVVGLARARHVSSKETGCKSGAAGKFGGEEVDAHVTALVRLGFLVPRRDTSSPSNEVSERVPSVWSALLQAL